MSDEITNFYEHLPRSGTIKNIVMFLHGLGADGRDLISLAPVFEQALPDTVFISPDAPFRCDMVPPGFAAGFQWFSLQDRDPDKIFKGIQIAAPVLDRFITEQLEKYDLPAERLALLGFSQGTMMSLYVGPRHKDKIAGILGYSGALFWENDTDISKLHKIPVYLAHGEADNVVPVGAYHVAKEALEQAGFDLNGHTTPGLLHGIDQEGIEKGISFLQSVLP